MKNWSALFAFGLALFLTACTTAEPTVPQVFNVELSGENVVPPSGVSATATATVTLTGRRLSVTGTYSSDLIVVVPGGHVHGPASTGEVSEAVILGPFAWDNSNQTFTSGDIPAVLTASQLEQFNDGLFYIDLHAGSEPSGNPAVLRGQIVPPLEGE